MQPLNCLIVDIPHIVLVDILRKIAEETGKLKVIEGVADSADLPTILSSQMVNVLIIGMKGFVLPKLYNDMLNRYSDLLIIGVVDDGRKAAVYINDIRNHEVSKIIEILGRR